MPVKTYDPKKVIVTFGGNIISGYADGTFINVSSPSDTFTKKVGADGEIARGRSNDDTAEVTLTLMATSASNAYLDSIRRIDKATGAGVRALSIQDLSGTTIFFYPEAWIRKMPDTEYGKEVSDRVWVLDTGQPAEDTL